MYGLTAGSIIPLTIVYLIRPESLTNLFDFMSSSFLIAFNWSEGVAQRFNLSYDLFSMNNHNTIVSMKMYSCYTIEYWYNVFSWIIYLCFILSFILLILNLRLKTSEEEFFQEDDHHDHYNLGIDFVFYYFCVFILAIISIFIRILMEHYLLGYLKPFTIVYLLWYIVSFAIVWLWNR
jgi:hypothetical protein